MENVEFSKTDFWWGLLRLAMTVKKRFMEPADTYNLTPLQAITLCMLRADQPCTMTSIARLLSCDPSNLSDTIERLVQAGYVVRKEEAHDRRSKILGLTEDGLRVRSGIFAAAAATPLPGADNLDEAEAATLRRLLVKALAST